MSTLAVSHEEFTKQLISNMKSAEMSTKRYGGPRKKKNPNAHACPNGTFSHSPSQPGSPQQWSNLSTFPPRSHVNNTPVFGPSVRPTLSQFVDLRTNIGYMTPFEMPIQEGDTPEVVAASSSPLASAVPGSFMGDYSPLRPTPQTHSPKALINQPSHTPSFPATPFGTPAAAHRHALDGISPSPRPCPPGEQFCTKLLYRTSDTWNETPQQSMYAASSAGLSASKSAVSDNMDVCKSLHLSQLHTPAKLDDNSRGNKRTKKQEVPSNPHFNINSEPQSMPRASSTHFHDYAGGMSKASRTSRRPMQSPSRALPEENSPLAVRPQHQMPLTLDPSLHVIELMTHYSVVVEGHFGSTSKLCGRSFFRNGTFVLFEGDRGTDMGRVISCELSTVPLENLNAGRTRGKDSVHYVLSEATESEIHNWKIVQPAEAKETLAACRALVAEKQCQLEMVGAAFQYDKKKLTFYYSTPAERVDFRSLLTPLYSIFHCRIWMERANEAPNDTTN